jgi:hypothetical protein
MTIHIKPSHEGLLHKDLGVKKGKKLSLKDEEAEKANGTPDEERESRRAKMKSALRK